MPYAVPVAVIPTGRSGIVLIGLPWGPTTNWARNVLAAGGARLTWKGQDHRLTEPRVIEAAEAVALAKPFYRRVVGRFPAAIVLTRPQGSPASHPRRPRHHSAEFSTACGLPLLAAPASAGVASQA